MSGSNAELKGRGCAALINLIVSTILLILLVALLLPGMIELPSWVYKVRDLTLADTRQIQREALPIFEKQSQVEPNLLILNLRLQQGLIEYESLKTQDNLRLLLTYKSPEQYEPLWEKEVAQIRINNLEDNLLIADQSKAYFVQNEMLYAFRLADGAKLWQLRLSDMVVRNCHKCLQLVPSTQTLLVLSKDQQLQGINPQDGKVIWKKRLNTWQVTNLGFEVLGQNIAFREEIIYPKQSGKQNDSEILLISAKDGKTKRAIILPSPKANIKIVEDKLYIINPEEGIIQLYCYAIGSGDLLWQTPFPKGYIWSDASSHWNFGGGKFYFVLEKNHKESLWTYNPTQQEFKEVYQTEDYSINILQAEREFVLLRAQKLRGSRRYELWQISLNQKRRDNWQIPLQISQWNHPNEMMFAYHLMANQRMLYIQRSDIQELLVRDINLKNGEILQEKKYRVRPNPWTGIYWDKRDVYISLKGLYRLDLQNRQFSLSWP